MSEPGYSGIWTFAEQRDGRVQRISFELLTRGRALADERGTELTALLFGDTLSEAGLQELIERGADRVLAVQAPELRHFLVEPYAACLTRLVRDRRPEILIAGATSTGRTLMPYAAMQLHAGLTADCTVLDIEPETGDLLQTRPAIGGNILATIKTPVQRPQMATVRPHSTKPAPRRAGRQGCIERCQAPGPEMCRSRTRHVEFRPAPDRHGLQDADIVVTVGRGVRRAQDIVLVQALADALDAALGASREVVDRGWLSYAHQVGLSGKTVMPRLYVAVGVSGAIQHLAGMQTAATIVAVNSDPDAQIFQVADVGIVGDLFEVVPALTAAIRSAAAEDASA